MSEPRRLVDTGILRKLLLSLLVLGAMSSFIGAGTFASFSALTTNGTNTFENGTVTMTNVAGSLVSGANCSTPTYNGTCAVLFNAGSTNLRPGATAINNTVTITYTGTLDTSDFVLYASGYAKNGASSATLCTATNPGLMLDLVITAGSTTIYTGTLNAFNTTHGSAGNGLQLTVGSGDPGEWTLNDSVVYTIAIGLNNGADNSYQGCQQDITFNWYAVQ